MLTEQRNPKSRQLDLMPTADILRLMNEDLLEVHTVIQDAVPAITRAVELIAERMRAGGRLIYVGAGTSGRLAMLDAVECVPTFGIAPGRVIALVAGGERALVESVEGAEDDEDLARADLQRVNAGADDVVVGIAASGRTPYVVAALEAARAAGASTVAISCNAPAPILDLADVPIPLPVGAEILTGSTRLKAGTTQKQVLNMISTAVMIRLNRVYDNLMVDVQMTNTKLAERARGIVETVLQTDAETAEALLQGAEGEVKTAIVMGRLKIPAHEARQRLAMAQGNLRAVLEGVS